MNHATDNAKRNKRKTNRSRLNKYGYKNCEMAHHFNTIKGYGASSIALEILSPNNRKNWTTQQVDAMINAWEVHLTLKES